MVVVMETKIHVYDISSMKILHTIDTCSNTRGVCALSPDDNSYVAYPYSSERGDIVIYDALSLQTVTLIHAHKTPLSKLAFNQTGAWIASASTKGTVIRAHAIVDSSKSFQFRRGSYPAIIHSLNFSPDSSLLAVSSDTGTIHIFKLDSSTAASPSVIKYKKFWGAMC
jgi:autophagy-related protein 18